MPHPKSKLKLALDRIPKKERKIVRPSFQPYGKKAVLKSAIDLLKPFPTPRDTSQVHPSKGDRTFPEFFSYLATRDDAERECQVLGRSYFDALVEELTAPRLPKVLETFAGIRDQSRALAEELALMSPAERYLANTVWGVYPASELNRLLELLDEMGAYGPPREDEPVENDRLGPGAMAQSLRRMGEFFEKLTRVLKRRYGRGEHGNVDSGGDINASRLIAPNPRWNLLHHSYELFHGLPHLAAEGGDSNLQEFVTYIHEWVTGDENASFERVMRNYLKVRRAVSECETQRRSLAGSCIDTGVTEQQFNDAVASSAARGPIPSGLIKKARQLDKQVAELTDRLQYGHRIPARDIASI